MCIWDSVKKIAAMVAGWTWLIFGGIIIVSSMISLISYIFGNEALFTTIWGIRQIIFLPSIGLALISLGVLGLVNIVIPKLAEVLGLA